MKKGWMKKSAHRSFLFQRGGREEGPGVQRFVKVRCHPSKADKVLLPLSVMR